MIPINLGLRSQHFSSVNLHKDYLTGLFEFLHYCHHGQGLLERSIAWRRMWGYPLFLQCVNGC